MSNDADVKTTPLDVAKWMVEQLDESADGQLLQQRAAYVIQELFGPEFVCRDQFGELGISRRVLYRFKQLTEDSVVWVAVQGDLLAGYWRKREPFDEHGRRQNYWQS